MLEMMFEFGKVVSFYDVVSMVCFGIKWLEQYMWDFEVSLCDFMDLDQVGRFS